MTIEEQKLNYSSKESKAEYEAQLWLRFKDLNELDARSELIDIHLPLARVIAAKTFARRVNDEIEFEEYHQYARLGLLESIDRFDYRLGIQFNSFADHRIRGSILNGLEIQTEKQQQISMLKRLRRERIESCLDAHHDDTESENDKDIFKYLAEVSVSLALSWLLEDTGMAESGADGSVDYLPVYRSIEIKQLQEQLKIQIDKLTSQENRFIRYHYFQGIPMSEIAEIFKVSKGRVSQINTSALLKLRKNLHVF